MKTIEVWENVGRFTYDQIETLLYYTVKAAVSEEDSVRQGYVHELLSEAQKHMESNAPQKYVFGY